MLEDWIFLISLAVCFVIGILIFKATFVSLREIVESEEKIPEDEVGRVGTKMVWFAIQFSFGINIIAYIVYGLILGVWSALIIQILVYGGFIILVGVSFIELYKFSGAREENAIFPNHKVYEALGTALYKKTSSKGITTMVMALLFYLIPFIVLLILNYNLITSLFFAVLYIPMLMLGYFYALGVFKSIKPVLYFKGTFSPLILIACILVGLFGFNIYTYFFDYYNYFPYLFLGTQLGIMGVIIIALVKGSKHRPLSMVHLFKERRRPFEYVYMGQVILQVSFYFLIVNLLLRIDLTDFRFTFINNLPIFGGLDIGLMSVFNLIFLISPAIFIGMIIYNRHRAFDVGIKNYIVEKVKNKKIPVDYKYLNDQIIIESIDELVDEGVIEPRFLINLIHCLRHEDVAQRRKAVVTLRKIMELDVEKIPLVVPYFMRMLKSDKVWTVRLEIAESLSKIIKHIPNEIPVILDYLQKESHDKNRYVRWGVLRVYESIITTELNRADELIPKVLGAFGDKEWSVRKGALDVIINLSKISPTIIPKVMPNCMDLLKTVQDEDLLETLYKFIEFCTGLEVTFDNYEHIVNEINSIVECMDEECQEVLYNNLKTIEDMKAKELEAIAMRKKQVDSFKDEKYKLSFD
ncbi:MAG: sister chromatid cohesion protein PDS5 [Candidatus Helarchaeota archaeon]